jgi:hypothetical protein
VLDRSKFTVREEKYMQMQSDKTRINALEGSVAIISLCLTLQIEVAGYFKVFVFIYQTT